MMDYEKAYKAVLQTATQWIKDGCTDEERICLECVFPELRESKDERIRKEIIEYFESRLSTAEEAEILYFKCWIAYLEKQKEQKPRWEINNPHTTRWTKEMIDEKFEELVEPKPGEWSKEDEMYLSQAIETLERENYLILADKLKSLRPQPKQGKKGLILTKEQEKEFGHLFSYPHWKPSEEQLDALLYAMHFVSPSKKESVTLSELYDQLKKL